MTSSFPGGLDSIGTVLTNSTVMLDTHKNHHNDLADAVNKIERNTPRLYNVKDTRYGAVADGVTDDTAAIQNAINDANTAGGGIVYLPPGTYFMDTFVTLKPNVTIQGSGMGVTTVKVSDTSNTTPFDASTGSVGSSTTLSSPIAIYDRNVALTSASAFNPGDYVLINDGTLLRAYVGRILAMSAGSNTVTMEERVPQDFATATTTFFKLNLADRICIRDLTMTTPGGNCLTLTTRKKGAIGLNKVSNTLVENVEIKGFCADSGGSVLHTGNCRNLIIRNNKFERCGDSDPAPSQVTQNIACYGNTQTQIVGNQFHRCGGSGMITCQASCFIAVQHNVIGGMTFWAANDPPNTTSTGSQTLQTSSFSFNVASTTGFSASGTFYVSDVNGVVQGITYTGGGGGGTSFTGCVARVSVNVPAGKLVSQQASVSDNAGRGIKFWHGCIFFNCSNNIIHDPGYDGIHPTAVRYGIISNNTIYGFGDIPINIGDDATNGVASDIVVEGNTINFSSPHVGTDHGIYIAGTSAGRCLRMTVANNQVSGLGASQPAVRLVNTTGAVVKGNWLTSVSYGVKVDTGCTQIHVQGNQINSGSTAGIRSLDSAGGNFILDNDIGTTQACEPHATDVFRPAIEKLALTYSASITPNAGMASYLTLAITNGTAFTINAPSFPSSGREIIFDIKNSSGGAHGVITWSTTYLGGGAGTVGTGAFTGIANGKRRIIVFRYDGTNWIEVSRTADV